MSNIVQSILASLVVAVILGILAYSLIIRENQIYIEVLTDKVEKTQQNLAENTKSINNLKVLIAQAFPKKQIFSISSSGNVKPIDISPLSTAVIISGANFTSELAKYANQKSDKPPKELIKSKEEYQLLYALAKQENPNIEEDLKNFRTSTIDTVKTDADLSAAHNAITDITRGPGKNNDLVKAREKLLKSDNGEVSKLIRDPKAIFPWSW